MVQARIIDERCEPCSLLKDDGGSRKQFSFRKCRGTEQSSAIGIGTKWCATFAQWQREDE
jgi:hypothetical protein